jgi:hypothetical protein
MLPSLVGQDPRGVGAHLLKFPPPGGFKKNPPSFKKEEGEHLVYTII